MPITTAQCAARLGRRNGYLEAKRLRSFGYIGIGGISFGLSAYLNQITPNPSNPILILWAFLLFGGMGLMMRGIAEWI
jgi:hypothetical protein